MKMHYIRYSNIPWICRKKEFSTLLPSSLCCPVRSISFFYVPMVRKTKLIATTWAIYCILLALWHTDWAMYSESHLSIPKINSKHKNCNFPAQKSISLYRTKLKRIENRRFTKLIFAKSVEYWLISSLPKWSLAKLNFCPVHTIQIPAQFFPQNRNHVNICRRTYRNGYPNLTWKWSRS